MTTTAPARRRAILFLLTCSFTATVAGSALAQARLEGRVVDAEGRPVAAATVIAVGASGAATSTVSRADGQFAFDGLPDGSYDLSASAPGLWGGRTAVAAGAGAAGRADITMHLSAVTETLVVSASQIDQPLSRTADSVTVIDGGDLAARQITTLGAALAAVPGFTVARSGGPGTLTSLFPRGGESDYTLVLVDGVRANAFGGGLDLSQVPLGDVDRIEVVRGPQSAIYGADAIGGVVQIISRQGGAPSAHAQVEAGSRATRRLLTGTTGEIGAWRWQAGSDYVQDDGFTGLAATGERVGNDDARERQGWAGAGWRGGRGSDVQGTFRYVDTDRGAPGPYGSDPAGRFGGVDRIARGTTTRHAIGLRAVQPWFGPSSRVRSRVEFDAADYDLAFVSAFGPSEADTRRLHGRVQTDAVAGGGVGVTGGVEWLSERARSTFITAAGDPTPVRRRVVGTFGEVRWSAHDRVTVQAGLRAEHITRHSLDGDGFSRPDFPADTVVSINPKLSASWLVSRSRPADGARAWTRLRTAAGTGIRPPDAFEVAFTDNPDLRPERSRSVEAGVTQALSGGAIQFDATVFYNQYDDLIVSVGSLRDVSRYRTDNISNARARGVEAAAAWRGPHGLGVRGAYTFLDTEIRAVDGLALAPSPYRVGDALLRRPRHQGSIAVDWSLARLTLFSLVSARGATLDAEPAFGPGGGLYRNPGRGILDVGGAYQAARRVNLFARVLNLLDRRYEEVLGFPSPGRTAFAGVRVAVRR